MAIITVIGIDPGLIDTGLVSLTFNNFLREITAHYAVTSRAKAPEIVENVRSLRAAHWSLEYHIFIEGYRPRSNFNTDVKMLELITQLKAEMPAAKVINNTGIKKVVKPKLLEFLRIDSFPLTTNHGDLVSAGRILVLGMLKDPELNKLLTSVFTDLYQGHPWTVIKP